MGGTSGDAAAPGEEAAAGPSTADRGGRGSEAGTLPPPPPPKRQRVFVRADELRQALQAEDPKALQGLRERYAAHTSQSVGSQQPVVLGPANPAWWVQPISNDPRSPWARAFPLTEHALQLAGREVAGFGQGFFVNGPVHLVTGAASAMYESSPGVQVAREVQEWRRAAANPRGVVAGYEEIARERRQALVGELQRLTTTGEGAGELLFDLSSLFVGGEGLAAKAGEISGAGGVSDLAQTLGRAGETSGESGPELFSRTSGKAMDRAEYARIKKAFERKPGHVIVDDHHATLELDWLGRRSGSRVEGRTLAENFILLRPGASRSAVFEELIHTAQLSRGMKANPDWLLMEIEAKQKLVKFQNRYRISDAENAETITELERLLDLQSK